MKEKSCKSDFLYFSFRSYQITQTTTLRLSKLFSHPSLRAHLCTQTSSFTQKWTKGFCACLYTLFNWGKKTECMYGIYL